MPAKNQNAANEIPSTPSGERVRVRGRGAIISAIATTTSSHQQTKLPDTFSPSGEKDGMRGRPPQYGQHRTRTSAARNFARQLRKKSTDAEKSLWRLLRNRRFSEFKFRRQYACGSYYLDFYCATAKLAVELDGGGHGFPDQRSKDEKRNAFLAANGILVLRFWNHQLRGKLESIRIEIWHALMERTGREREMAGFLPKPPPAPST